MPKVTVIKDDDEEDRKPFWRCEECGHVDRERAMPADRNKHYARAESHKCPRCRSAAFVAVGF